MGETGLRLPEPRIAPPLEPEFRPAVLANHTFLQEVKASGAGLPLRIALERGGGAISVYETSVFPPGHPSAARNFPYVERLVKTLLWQRGGWRVVVGGPEEIGAFVKKTYGPGGERAWDAEFMGGVYEQPFTVEVTTPEKVPSAREETVAIGRHLEGCRIGFDAGASDRKVAAVIDGESVYSEEVPWDPRNQKDPEYHYQHITSALKSAAAHLPRVDAIGVSAAGIYINNRVAVASLFRGVPKDLFEAKVKDMFLRIKKEWGDVPLEVVNDGEVTALAGSMSLEANCVLGIAMGSSEAAGYVNEEGNLTGWLNELAFVPIDFNPNGPVDEWSNDRGVGSQYFSQQAVIRLAPRANIALEASKPPADQLVEVQDLMAKGDERAAAIFESIGCYTGYGVAHYADFYDIRHVLILGRVTSGEGGNIVLAKAREVLREEFPALHSTIALHLPDEKSRRVGQAVAAASLAEVK